MDLQQLRQQIDRLDNEIVQLLNQRAALALQISQEKQRLNLPIYDQSREQKVLQRVVKINPGPLTDTAVYNLYQEIIKICRDIQRGGKKI